MIDSETLLKILDDQKDARSLAVEVSNRTYSALCSIFEHLEHTGKIYGNGHHMAQKFARAAELIILKRHANSTKEVKEQALKELSQLRWE